MRMKRGKVPHEGSDKGVHNILENKRPALKNRAVVLMLIFKNNCERQSCSSQRGKKVIHTMKLSKRSD